MLSLTLIRYLFIPLSKLGPESDPTDGLVTRSLVEDRAGVERWRIQVQAHRPVGVAAVLNPMKPE